MRSRGRPAVLGLLGAALLLLAGCAGASEVASPETSPSSPPVPVATRLASPLATARTPKAPRSGRPQVWPPQTTSNTDLEDLAGLAEQLASGAPAKSGVGLDGEQVLGADISWPNCPRGLGIAQRRTKGLPLPLPTARYVIIGLTNGPGFTSNPCLTDQVAFARGRGLPTAAYAVASYPNASAIAAYGADGPFDGDTALGALGNTGYQQARHNLATLARAGLATPLVWIDVEPVPDFEWSGDVAANAAVVGGAARGYTDAGYRIGVYSTPYLWAGIVGDLRLGAPEWRAAGATSQAEAVRRCGADNSIQGGPALLGQWVQGERDLDVTCPGVHRIGELFGSS